MLGWRETTTLKLISLHKFIGTEFNAIYKTLFDIIKKKTGADYVEKIIETKNNRLEGLKAYQKAPIRQKSLLSWIEDDKKLKYLFTHELDCLLINSRVDFSTFQMDLYYEYLSSDLEIQKEKHAAHGDLKKLENMLK